MEEGQLLVLRSTIYPGTTEWLSNYLEGLGRRLLVAYCPERVVQMVSGTTPEAEEKAGALFGRIASEIVRLKPLEAEFAKLFTNVYRYVEFATTNQISFT